MEEQSGMPDDIFTMYEARRYLGGAGRSTMQRYMLNKQLPYELTSEGRAFFRRRDLDAIRPILDHNREVYRSEDGAQKRRKKTEGE